MQNKRFGALSSSVNPQELSKTVEGVFYTISVLLATPMAAGLLSISGVDLSPADVSESIKALSAGVGLTISNSIILFGVIRKIFVLIYDKISTRL